MDKFSDYLRNFDYQERLDMKIKKEELLELHVRDEIQIIDIRFKEEYEAWNVGFIANIPLNELPNRLNELDKSKTIVCVCPHYDRAEIARLYLKVQGYKSRYLTDGLLGIVELFRGDKARDYMQKIKNKQNKGK
jgi:rhodanese-related sulfurtransferase